jgi:hypothetical protein
VSLPHASTAAVRANRAAADVTWTTVLAAQKIEELRSQPFPQLAEMGEFSDSLDARGSPVESPWQAPAYSRTWRTEPLPAAPEHAIVITVIVAPSRHAAGHGSDAATPGATRLVTLRTRKAP